MVAAPTSFILESSVATSEDDAIVSGTTSIHGLETSAYGDIIFPLFYPGHEVAAYAYDSVADAWQCVLPATNSPESVVLRNVLSDRSYLLEVFADDPADREMVSVHRSWFDSRLDPPKEIEAHEASARVADGVGTPTVRLMAPSVDGTLTVKLYSSKVGVVQTLSEISGGDTIELTIPEWNGWFWISGWRDADNALVMSLWLRHEIEE